MSPATVVLSLILSCVAFYALGAWAAWNPNPGDWEQWLRALCGFGAFGFWAYDTQL